MLVQLGEKENLERYSTAQVKTYAAAENRMVNSTYSGKYIQYESIRFMTSMHKVLHKLSSRLMR